MSCIGKIVMGYGSLLKKWSRTILTTIKIILFLFFVFSLSVVIVYPLWNLATNSPEKYSQLVIILSLTLFLSYITYKLIIVIKNIGLKATFYNIFYPKIKKFSFIILALFLIFLSIYVYTIFSLLGIILTIFMIIFFGYVNFVYKS